MSDWHPDEEDGRTPDAAVTSARAGRGAASGSSRPKLVGSTAFYVILSLIAALVFGSSSDLFRRAWGDPQVQGLWVSIGSALFILWVIAVTIYAGLRVSVLVAGVLFRVTTRTSVFVYDVLRTPLKIATYLAVTALAAYGAYVLFLGLSTTP